MSRSLGQITGGLVVSGDMAFTDAGAADDPPIGSVYHPLEISIRQNTFWEIAAGAGDP